MEGFRRSNFFPYKATLTEENLPDQTGKVFIVTGGSSGVGKELVKILYQHNARVYLATRNQQAVESVISELKSEIPNSKGELFFLKLVLDDLTTIKTAALEFIASEKRLDVLWNNAGVMNSPQGSKTVQGYELQQGTNVLGHFLFVHFLTPILKETARTAPRNSVRVVWVSSLSIDFAPKPPIDFSNMDYHVDEAPALKYNRSKVGNLLNAVEFDRRTREDGIVSLSMSPGLLRTNLQKNNNALQHFVFKFISHPAKFGGYTELFAGLDKSIDQDVKWVTPFGRVEKPRQDLTDPELAKKYWAWCEEQVKPYL